MPSDSLWSCIFMKTALVWKLVGSLYRSVYIAWGPNYRPVNIKVQCMRYWPLWPTLQRHSHLPVKHSASDKLPRLFKALLLYMSMCTLPLPIESRRTNGTDPRFSRPWKIFFQNYNRVGCGFPCYSCSWRPDGALQPTVAKERAHGVLFESVETARFNSTWQ